MAAVAASSSVWRRPVVPASSRAPFDQSGHQPPAGGVDLGPLLAPGPIDALEHLPERRHTVARLVREVGAAIERPAVGRQEDRHRPAATAGHRLDGRHVHLVEVGPFLAIDLDRDEVVVEIARRRLVLERFALHDVAPVAGRVADRQEDRPVLRLRRRRARRDPTGTSRPGCGRAGGGTGWSLRPGGWAWTRWYAVAAMRQMVRRGTASVASSPEFARFCWRNQTRPKYPSLPHTERALCRETF